jgi:hypothetical protein
VSIGALTSKGCFLGVLGADSSGLIIVLSINLPIMKHTSLLPVSRKVSLTYPNADQVWRRLQWTNLVLTPLSVETAVVWATAHLHLHSTPSSSWQRVNEYLLPSFLGVWGFVAAFMSLAFVYQMCKYQWTVVERKGMLVLVVLAIADLVCLILTIKVGDLEALCL